MRFANSSVVSSRFSGLCLRLLIIAPFFVSEVEVFANDRQCLTKRIYTSRPDSIGIQGFATKKDAVIKTLSVWNMTPIWTS